MLALRWLVVLGQLVLVNRQLGMVGRRKSQQLVLEWGCEDVELVELVRDVVVGLVALLVGGLVVGLVALLVEVVVVSC